MNRLVPRLAIALLTSATCLVAGAQTTAGSNSDEARRDQNRDEALSAWRARHPTLARTDMRERPAQRHRPRTARERTHRVAESVRGAGHRVAEKARDITDKTNEKFDKPKRNP